VALIVLVLSILSVQYALVMRIATELLISVVQSAGATMIAWHLVQSAVAMRCVTESLREGRALFLVQLHVSLGATFRVLHFIGILPLLL
jgi:hypothetical protein